MDTQSIDNYIDVPSGSEGSVTLNHDEEFQELPRNLGTAYASSIRGLDNLTESVALCKKPLCEDADLECIENLVDATICEAVTIIESDPRQLFCYKYPKPSQAVRDNSSGPFVDVVVANSPGGGSTVAAATINIYSHTQMETSAHVRSWMTIRNFEYANVISEIRDFISKWQLSPETKCVVLSNSRRLDVPLKGTIYFVDAHFSRPTRRCPNPLAVAKVRFIITVSNLLLKHYPVMITYRFEGYNTLYYAVGERALNSFTFQRFYIDTILHTKLCFYAEICECRHGTLDNPKDDVQPDKTQKHK